MDVHPILVPAIFDLSTTHLIIIAVILLLLFGAKLPSIMRNLGGSVREFKKGMDTSEPPTAYTPEPPPPPAPKAPEGAVSRYEQNPPPPPKA